MNLTVDHERIFLRAYENALSSAFAHGSTLTDFRFHLPAPDDVIVFANGNKALRADTHDSGYSHDELALHAVLTRNMGAQDVVPLRIPSTFLDDTDTILESHFNDLFEIARGLVRANVHENATCKDAMNGVATFTDVFTAFTNASFAFHEALLHATDALLNIDRPTPAALLMHEHFPSLLEAQESLTLTARRFSHPDFLQAIEKGAHNQIRLFLLFGKESGRENDFFIRHVNKLSVYA